VKVALGECMLTAEVQRCTRSEIQAGWLTDGWIGGRGCSIDRRVACGRGIMDLEV
jgi:hypothetical protein